MSDHSLDNERVISSDFTLKSSVDVSKKCWQTPKLVEMEYNETKGGPDGANDGEGLS